MPAINEYKCNRCNFSLKGGWGGYMYVRNKHDERVRCSHPSEWITVYEQIGIIRGLIQKLTKTRIGFNSHCVCCDCLSQFDLDIPDQSKESWQNYYGIKKNRDERKCIKCNSNNVNTVFESIERPCPKCKEGVIKEIDIGLMT